MHYFLIILLLFTFSSSLAYNTTLTSLSIKSRNFGNMGASEGDSFDPKKSLSGRKITPRDLMMILPRLSGYSDVNLDDNALGPQGAGMLAPYTDHFEHLSVARNGIDGEGAVALIQSFFTNTTTKTLNLSGNPLGMQAAQLLGKILENNDTLETLHLNDCHLGDLGVEALARGLAVNQSLRTLSLDRNGITDKGLGALVHALSHNSRLESLTLDDNNITPTAARQLRRVLSVMHDGRRGAPPWEGSLPPIVPEAQGAWGKALARF